MRELLKWVTALSVITALAGCTGNPVVGGADASNDIAPRCAEGETECGGVCVNLQRNRDNCGACGTACRDGLVCMAGRCAQSCPASQTLCGGLCVTTMTDRANCGSCGVNCAAGQVCSNGACALTCASDLATDRKSVV